MIPANIIFIEEGTFADLKDVEWYETEPDNPVYVSRDGVLFSEQETCLFAFPAGRTGIYPIPENVVRLAKDAFSESRLFKVIGMKERGMEQIHWWLNNPAGCDIIIHCRSACAETRA